MSAKTKKIILAGILLVLAFLFLFRGNFPNARVIQEKNNLTEINVGLSWIHEAQFAGFYAADKYGYFADEGLKINLYPYNDEDLAQELVNKKYDFAILQADTLLLAREKGLPVKGVFADYQIIPTVYFSKKSLNIRSPKDLIGKKIGAAYSEKYPLLAMIQKESLPLKNITIIDRIYDYSPLASGEYDVEAGWITDGDSVASAIGEFNTISPYEYGINWYADILAVGEETLKDNPKLVESFVRALSRGWRKAIENPKECALLAKQYNPELSDQHLVYVLEKSIPYIYSGEDILGWMNEPVFDDAQKILLEQGVMKSSVNISNVCDTGPITRGGGL